MWQTLYSILSLISFGVIANNLQEKDRSPSHFLSLGDRSLTSSEADEAIKYYRKGIEFLSDDDSLLTVLSLYTNLGSALSSVGKDEGSIEFYRKGLSKYADDIDEIVDDTIKNEASKISAQASFFLGMVYQELGQPQQSADAYSYANTLDPYHWASLANLGSVLHDDLKQHRNALIAYNKAYEILTQQDAQPTDPPEEPRFILSQLQYRIGLAIFYDPVQKCVLMDDPNKEPVSCKEMAANAFSTALKYDPNNELAKHMLATITADATMTRASNSYVKMLFDDYAHNFEHSLVDELGYTGFERLRRAFDRSFGGAEKVPRFTLVVDAGCGTGLVGEQFRNISERLIGVDLSESILNEASKARPHLYDEMRVGDAMQVFIEMKPISLIIAGDSYIYFGDLDPLFGAMQEGLEGGGIVAFTLENVDKETAQTLQQTKPDWRWQLTASGRFAHRKDYVERVSKSKGFSLVHYEALVDFRFENGVGVQGHVFILRKELNDEL